MPAIEDKLIANLIATKRVLFFDEGEFFSTYVLNLLKTLLNKTQLIAVIACTPRAHAKWNMYYPDEADQIARRTHAVVQVSSISVEDADMFFPEGQFEERKPAVGLIVPRKLQRVRTLPFQVARDGRTPQENQRGGKEGSRTGHQRFARANGPRGLGRPFLQEQITGITPQPTTKNNAMRNP